MRNDPQHSTHHYVRMVRKSTAKAPARPIWYVKEWLAHKGLKQKHLVERTSYNKGQVSEYLSGDRRWNEDVLAAFADAIGVEASDLLKPPRQVENELAAYVMAMDDRKRGRALKILKAMEEDQDAPGKGKLAS